jgi:hypothetical protein
MEGEIIPTPGHSDDRISLILDEGTAYSGLPGRAWETGLRLWVILNIFLISLFLFKKNYVIGKRLFYIH